MIIKQNKMVSGPFLYPFLIVLHGQIKYYATLSLSALKASFDW